LAQSENQRVGSVHDGGYQAGKLSASSAHQGENDCVKTKARRANPLELFIL